MRPNHRQHQLGRALPAGRAGGTSGTLEGHGDGAGCDAGSADGRAWCPIFKWEKDGKRMEKWKNDRIMLGLWWVYGGFMVDLWWIYGGFTVDLWCLYMM